MLLWSKETVPTEGLGLCKSHHEAALLPDVDPEATRPAGRMLPCGVSEVSYPCRSLVQARSPDTERQTATDSRGPTGCCWEVRDYRLAYVSPHVPFVAGETGAPMKVQQDLMRHASIQTTMNVYGQAMTSSKRQANSKVVEMVLKPIQASA